MSFPPAEERMHSQFRFYHNKSPEALRASSTEREQRETQAISKCLTASSVGSKDKDHFEMLGKHNRWQAKPRKHNIQKMGEAVSADLKKTVRIRNGLAAMHETKREMAGPRAINAYPVPPVTVMSPPDHNLQSEFLQQLLLLSSLLADGNLHSATNRIPSEQLAPTS